ncbi:hypothetical protein L2E82_36163 [Cichorium intybus]|uniref:Uncharacterized protein n=1 Tax=Cichorium intybus TaxID=13427 RepID=A0ACB9BR55_CICIN|nr:hypothetical protein L2E82_36163 [Cichorium intybus]
MLQGTGEIDLEKRGQHWGMMVWSSPDDWKRNMETIVRWSPYSSEEGLLQQIDFEKRGQHWGMMVRSSPDDWKRNMETIVRWSPYSSEEGLLQQVMLLFYL